MSLSSPVGRDRELADTQRVLDDTAVGGGATVVVTGESGSGTTTVLEAVAGQAKERNLAIAASERERTRNGKRRREHRDPNEPLSFLRRVLRRDPSLVR